MPLIYFFYGLSFLTLGILILKVPRKCDILDLFKYINYLAFFAITHAVVEWIDFLIITEMFNDTSSLKTISNLLLAISFTFLFIFASKTLAGEKENLKFLKHLWILCPFIYLINNFYYESHLININIRYFIGFPACILSALSIYLALNKIKKKLPKTLIYASKVAYISFIVYGILTGLIVEESDYFLSEFLNQEVFFDILKVPAQLFRMICAIILTTSFYITSSVFFMDGDKLKVSGGIRTKITLTFIISNFMIFSTGITLSYYFGFNIVFNSTGRNLEKISKIISASINQMINEEIVHINTLINNKETIRILENSNLRYLNKNSSEILQKMKLLDNRWQNPDDNTFKKISDNDLSENLHRISEQSINIAEIFITDIKGGIVALSGKTTDYYQADEKWWMNGYNNGKGKLYIENVEFDTSAKEWSVAFIFPIRNKSKKLIGICKSIVGLQAFYSQLAKFNVGRTGHAVLVNKAGYIIYHHGIEPLKKHFFEDKSIDKLNLLKNKWSIVKHTHGKSNEILFAYSEVKSKHLVDNNINWSVYLYQDKNEVFSLLNTLITYIIIAFVFTIIIYILVSSYTAVRLSRPILLLAKAAKGLSGGEVLEELALETGDEIETLADSFNIMGKNIRDNQKQILDKSNYTDSILASMGNALIVLNSEGAIKSVNKAACNLLEYTENEFIGMPFVNILENKDLNTDMQKSNLFISTYGLDELLEDGSVNDLELVYKSKKGEKIPVLFSGNILYHKNKDLLENNLKNISDIVTVSQDMRNVRTLVSDLKDAKKELNVWSIELENRVKKRTIELENSQKASLNIMEDLQELNEMLETSNDNFYSIVDKSTDGILITDKSGVIIFANPATSILFNKSGNELIGDKFNYKISHKETIEIKIKTSDQKKIGEMNVAETKWEGKDAYIISISDITKRKESEELKNEFISTVSHELRTPLTILKESINLVLDEVTGKIVPEQKTILITGRKSIDRLSKLINNLLDISKIEAGKLELHRSFININDLIVETFNEFKYFAKEKKINFTNNPLPIDTFLYIDTDKIREILVNLISNAFKFTSNEGSITITSKNEYDKIIIIVSDTGLGISKENLPHLFDKFTQFGRKPGPGVKGTGLGLAISKAIISLHNGKIWADSKLNKGSNFHFSIPKSLSVKVIKKHISQSISYGKDKKITTTFILIKLDKFINMLKEDHTFASDLLEKLELSVKNVLRKNDDIIKLPGIFLITLPNVSRDSVIKIIEKLEKSLIKIKGRLSTKLNISINAATWPEDGNDKKILNKLEIDKLAELFKNV